MKRSRMSPERYLRYILPSSLFHTQRTKQILNVNPTLPQERAPIGKVCISVYDYNAQTILETNHESVEEILACKENGLNSWINIDGIR
ncbi:MAG: corA, partial [Flaviaesturariibacter sp.]|nr:corA [Flaviaesturariibacter sp.]